MGDFNTEKRYRECVRKLYTIAPSFQRVGAAGYHPGLETMESFAGFLKDPHKSLKTIHIAGTNGKGSVAHMLAAALAFACPGRTVGLYTSPHLLDFRERIRVISTEYDAGGVCCREIGKEEVVDFLTHASGFIENHGPSFFEITTAMALDYFSRIKLDVAVIETGLGGRLDSTNIITPELSIITSIGFDHKDILGDTIGKIAAEKAGIIKPGVPVVVGELPDEAMSAITARTVETGSRLYRSVDVCSENTDPAEAAAEADLRSFTQIRNIRTVFKAIEVLGEGPVRKGSQLYRGIVGAAHVTGLRGRWERLGDNPAVVCDIGHNVEAMTVSVCQMKKEFAGRRLFIVFGMAADKDVEAVLGLLPRDAEYVFTQASGSRAMPCLRLQELARQAGLVRSVAVPAVGAAVQLAVSEAGGNDAVFIGGSSYVVAEALEYWDKNQYNNNVKK